MAGEDADNQDMSDLSRLLDDVYRTEPATTSWATDTAKVFTGWLPEAADEPDVVVVVDPVDALERILEQGLQTTSEPERPAAEPPAAPRAWQLEDDDILPAKAPRRSFSFLRR